MSKHVVLTRKAAMTMGALQGFLKPRLAQDAKLNLLPILGRVTSKNFDAMKPKIAADVKKLIQGKLAKDASAEGLAELLDALGKEKAGMDDPLPLETDVNGGLPPLDKSLDEDGPDAGKHEEILAFLQDKLSPEDLEAVQQLIGSEAADAEPEDVDPDKLGTKGASKKGEDEDMDEDDKDKKKAKDEPPPFKGKPEVGGGMSKDAVNRAIKLASDAAVKTAVKQAQETAAAVREAERFVRPWVGDVAMAHDSAAEVYHTALTALNVDVADVHPSAYKAILQRVPLPGKQQETVAMDSASTTDFATRFPEAARIKFA